MNLISLKFIMLATVTVILYWILYWGGVKRYRWIVLLISSIAFYLGAGTRACISIFLASVLTFYMAKIIEKLEAENPKRRICLIICIVIIAGWLMLTKLSGVYLPNCPLFAATLGISYVSFSLISYLADVYWEKDIADKNFMKFLLYVLFFPKILQGPITKHKDLAFQLYEGGVPTYENTCFGLQRMVYGYFKKSVIADRAAVLTTTVFSDVSMYSGSVISVAVIVASLQLYCDFSGYMDIVLGFVQILGIEMDENFKHPFFSKNVAEFWRRWHITLGIWFRDYVYTPVAMSQPVKKIGKLGRKRMGKRFGNSMIKVIALSTVWILTGVWHGIGINYILWGVYWGSIIIFSTVFENEITRINDWLHINTDAESWKLFQMVRTFLLFCLGIMITRLSHFYEIKIAMYHVFKQFKIVDLFNGTLYSLGLNRVNFNIMIVSFCVVWIISILQERGSIRQRIAGLNALARWSMYAISISAVLFLGMYGPEYSTVSFAYTYF